MRLFFCIVVLITTIDNIKAQNLVPNPGFELFFDYPTSYGQISRTRNWKSGNSGTPEYYRTDSEFKGSGSESGKGYSGLILFGDYPKAVEYLVVELIDSLEADSQYCLSFSVKAEDSFVYIDQIGMHLSMEDIRLRMWAPIHLKPTLSTKYGEPIVPQLGWKKVVGEFRANGGEKFVTIGNFQVPDKHVLFVDEYVSRERGWNSYYYIDNVWVYKKSAERGCELSFTQKLVSEVKTKKAKSEVSVYFDFDSTDLTNQELKKLLKWLDGIKFSELNSVTLDGYTDSKGSNDYNDLLSKERVLYVLNILNSSYDKSDFYKINYFGELNPISPNQSDSGRALNRRVEINLNYND
ncbi:MAG: OmpA family protein [Salibacteraceae bacterium]